MRRSYKPRHVSVLFGNRENDVGTAVAIHVRDLHRCPRVPLREPPHFPCASASRGAFPWVREPEAANREVRVAVAVEIAGVEPVAAETRIETDARPGVLAVLRSTPVAAHRHVELAVIEVGECRASRGANPVRSPCPSRTAILVPGRPTTTSLSPSPSTSPTALPDSELADAAMVEGFQSGFRYQTTQAPRTRRRPDPGAATRRAARGVVQRQVGSDRATERRQGRPATAERKRNARSDAP